MKKKILIGITAAALASAAMSACGSKSAEPASEPASTAEMTTEQTSASAETQAETSAAEPTKAETGAAETMMSETEAPESTEAAGMGTETAAASENGGQSALGEQYVDMEKIQFSIDGKVYTLGKTTLQEMIDDGVKFNEKDLANAQNNLNDRTESDTFKIMLSDTSFLQVTFLNVSGSNQKIADSFVNSLYWDVDPEQSSVAFTFPLSMTEDEIKEKAGEPTKFDEYKDGDYVQHTYEYTREGQKFLRSFGYEFRFLRGKLDYITLKWSE